MKELIKQLEVIKQDLIQGKIRQQIDHRLSRSIEDKIDKAINYIPCCNNNVDAIFETTSKFPDEEIDWHEEQEIKARKSGMTSEQILNGEHHDMIF